LTPNLFIGSVCIRLERVDSSNNYARELIRDKMPIEGTVIVANEQTSGRGQRANTWFSEPKSNLTCSYILRPVFLAAKNQFVLSAAVALAVFETVYQFIPNNTLRIKWPNDILVGDKKIAGILIENTLRRSNLETSIIGIGLNVNQVKFPSELNATSIQLNANTETDLNLVLEELNTRLEKYYLQIREGSFDLILKRLNENLFGVEESMKLTINGSQETVTVIGVRHSGELELEHADMRRTLHQHHEIGWNL
jgi:BirA family biotin operon repressor/biotin-[acetyl-CoA-carboxylase] ligase